MKFDRDDLATHNNFHCKFDLNQPSGSEVDFSGECTPLRPIERTEYNFNMSKVVNTPELVFFVGKVFGFC